MLLCSMSLAAARLAETDYFSAQSCMNFLLEILSDYLTTILSLHATAWSIYIILSIIPLVNSAPIKEIVPKYFCINADYDKHTFRVFK